MAFITKYCPKNKDKMMNNFEDKFGQYFETPIWLKRSLSIKGTRRKTKTVIKDET